MSLESLTAYSVFLTVAFVLSSMQGMSYSHSRVVASLSSPVHDQQTVRLPHFLTLRYIADRKASRMHRRRTADVYWRIAKKGTEPLSRKYYRDDDEVRFGRENGTRSQVC